jgi:hypothetical protein
METSSSYVDACKRWTAFNFASLLPHPAACKAVDIPLDAVDVAATVAAWVEEEGILVVSDFDAIAVRVGGSIKEVARVVAGLEEAGLCKRGGSDVLLVRVYEEKGLPLSGEVVGGLLRDYLEAPGSVESVAAAERMKGILVGYRRPAAGA